MQRSRPSTGRAPLKLETGTATAARSKLPLGRCRWLAPPPEALLALRACTRHAHGAHIARGPWQLQRLTWPVYTLRCLKTPNCPGEVTSFTKCPAPSGCRGHKAPITIYIVFGCLLQYFPAHPTGWGSQSDAKVATLTILATFPTFPYVCRFW